MSPSSTDARSRLAQAAVEAFGVRGFHGTTTRDISTTAGMSPAAMYVHHRSKEDLLFELSLSGHQRMLELVSASMAVSDDPVVQLATFVEDFVRDHAAEPTLARVINYELDALTPEHFAEIVVLRREVDRALRSVIRRGVDAGVFSTPDPAMTTLALLSFGIDVSRWYRPGGRWTPDQVAAHYRLLALRMVGVAGSP